MLNLKKTVAVALGLILIIIVGVSLVLYENDFLKPTSQNASSPDSRDIAWQIEVQHFLTDTAAADGKVFVTDQDATVQCYHEGNGKQVWETPLDYADYGGGPQVLVYQDKVYANTGGNLVKRLNENTGAVEMQYQAPLIGIDDYKFLSSFTLADGKVFAFDSGSTCGAVYDVASGQQFWTDSGEGLIVNYSMAPFSNSNYAYLVPNGAEVQRLNPNNSKVIWSFPDATTTPPIVSDDQVILWNYEANYSYPQKEHAIVCLNVETGKQIWRVDPDASVFQPTVSDGLLLFGSADGYFYALNMANGSQKWKTNIDTSGMISYYNEHYSSPPPSTYISLTAGPPLVDSENQRVFWTVFSGGISYENEPVNNSGTIMSLNLNTGDILWDTPVEKSSIYGVHGQPLALLNSKLFAAGDNGILCLSADTGSITWERTFYHYVGNPIAAEGKVFVAADLYLIAYK